MRAVDLDLPAVAMLAQSALDILWLAERDEGCCPECCGPCFALRTLLNAGQLDELLATDPATEGMLWWVKGRVDREWLTRAWRLTDCHDSDKS